MAMWGSCYKNLGGVLSHKSAKTKGADSVEGCVPVGVFLASDNGWRNPKKKEKGKDSLSGFYLVIYLYIHT